MTFEFVHNNKTMDNYFNQKVLAKLFDVHKVTVGEHLNNYLKSLENFQGNSLKVQIKLKNMLEVEELKSDKYLQVYKGVN